jgi:alkylhydroperoxidase family enzyme
MTWLPETGHGGTPFARVLALRPELQADVEAFTDLIWARGGVNPVVLELCRLRIAGILGCESELRRRTPAAQAAGLTEATIAELDDWRTSERFYPPEQACLGLAEQFVLDPRGVGDDAVAAGTAHLSPAQAVALVEALAMFDGFTRFRMILAATSGS